MATYSVNVSLQAEDDLTRLFDFIAQRELARAAPDLTLPPRAIETIREALKVLERFPFTCRKAGASSFIRELVIPFGHTGYVALFEIVDDTRVVVSAVRHQREDDYH